MCQKFILRNYREFGYEIDKRTCVGYEDESDDEDSEEREDEENKEDYVEIKFIGYNDVEIIGDNEAFEVFTEVI